MVFLTLIQGHAYWFRESGREGEWEWNINVREKHRLVASCDWTCPNWESWAPTEPHRPGHYMYVKVTNFTFLFHFLLGNCMWTAIGYHVWFQMWHVVPGDHGYRTRGWRPSTGRPASHARTLQNTKVCGFWYLVQCLQPSFPPPATERSSCSSWKYPDTCQPVGGTVARNIIVLLLRYCICSIVSFHWSTQKSFLLIHSMSFSFCRHLISENSSSSQSLFTRNWVQQPGPRACNSDLLCVTLSI